MLSTLLWWVFFAARGLVLPEVAGWTMVEGPTFYSPRTLYEYIDGGADAFLMFDFEELASAAYRNAGKAEVSVDIYRHRDARRAFGMYTQERPAGVRPLAIGTEAYAGEDHLEMVAGPYYVKLVLARSQDAGILRAFAERIAAGLPGTREPPPCLRWFPGAGKLPRAEKLTARDFLGHPFLHDACTAPYELGGKRFRLFVIEARDDAEAREMVRRYLVATKAPGAPVPSEGAATPKDPVNGQVDLRWKGRWLWGAADEAAPGRQALVEELGRSVAAQP